MKDTKATTSSNKNDYVISTDYVYDSVFDPSLEKCAARQMVSVSSKASPGETTRDIDELLTVHEDVLWNENPMSEVKRIQRWGQNGAANLYINDVVFTRPNVRQDL